MLPAPDGLFIHPRAADCTMTSPPAYATRRPMTAEEKKAVSERITASWAERRKKAAK